MNNFTNHMFFISAEKSNRPSMVNNVNSLDLHYQLKREFTSITPVTGCYQGRSEASFMVTVSFAEVERSKGILESLMREYDQDSIAYVDNERRLTLVYSTGNQEYIGVLKESPDATDYYTELNGVKYAAK